MTFETTEKQGDSIGVQIANQIIDLANTRLEEGDPAEEVASGLRHAAANFSAYAFFRSEKYPKDPNDTVDAFVSFFEHYLDVHKPKAAPEQKFAQLIEQAKKEL